MKVTELLQDFESTFKEVFNDYVDLINAKAKKVVDFSLGFDDPLSLKKYPACQIVFDRLRFIRAEATAEVSVDILVAFKGANKKEINTTGLIYSDAMTALIKANPYFAGVYLVQVESIEYIDFNPVNNQLGVIVARLIVTADNLLE